MRPPHCAIEQIALTRAMKTFGFENWLLHGREVYVATMGEVNQVVFVSEILSQIRSRGLDLDRLAQHKVLQDGHTLGKREAIHLQTTCGPGAAVGTYYST